MPGAKHPFVEQAAHGKHGVANDFGFQTFATLVPTQQIVMIDGPTGGIVFVAFQIDRAGQNQLVDRFESPTAMHQFDGQPIEQLGMSRSHPLRAEITRRGDNSPSQVMLPEAVDDHPGEQLTSSVIDVGDPIGERLPPKSRPGAGGGAICQWASPSG